MINANEKQVEMNEDQKYILNILKSPSFKTEENIKFLQEYFSHFDFMQKEASLDKKGKSSSQRNQSILKD